MGNEGFGVCVFLLCGLAVKSTLLLLYLASLSQTGVEAATQYKWFVIAVAHSSINPLASCFAVSFSCFFKPTRTAKLCYVSIKHLLLAVELFREHTSTK